MLRDEILFLPITELSKRIQQRQLSPVELTESYLDRSRTIGARLNAYATLMPELALKQAHAAEKEIASGKYRGPLHGIPYAAKDLLAVRGYPTSWGARPCSDQHFDYDATVIRRLESAGAILVGKAAMIELAGGMGYRYASASASGPAKNPWNEGYWTCGSSSGSAAVVAGGLAAFAIGTETWGSIICPSGFTGLAGLRPTLGRVSRYGAMALAYSMDKIGPMCRLAEDCDLVLKVIAGHDPQDGYSLPAPHATYTGAGPLKGRLRIGWILNQWKEPSAEVDKATSAARELLEKNPAVAMDTVSLPEGPWETAAGVIVSAEGAAAFHELIASGRVKDLSDPLGKIGGYMNEEISASDLLLAERIRTVVQKKMDALFEHVDVLATPSLPVTASKIDANLDLELSFADPLGGIGNMCGLPAISVPCGFGNNNLPIGIQFVGRALDDVKVIQAARLFQTHADWHKQHPKLS
ncbi:MAG TPA: amidase [Candidatus Angelobacter sp.]|jgi:aspartyl-tRNA(Asn)/glutamyl-tRNA(Gln) amidotransferase subunit A|nr:amidase [Candidatus Angelobacter sp.]